MRSAPWNLNELLAALGSLAGQTDADFIHESSYWRARMQLADEAAVAFVRWRSAEDPSVPLAEVELRLSSILNLTEDLLKLLPWGGRGGPLLAST